MTLPATALICAALDQTCLRICTSLERGRDLVMVTKGSVSHCSTQALTWPEDGGRKGLPHLIGESRASKRKQGAPHKPIFIPGICLGPLAFQLSPYIPHCR